MIPLDLKGEVRQQMHGLQSLLNYLEDREVLGAKEYLFCQARLHDTLKQLKRLERTISEAKS